MTREELVNQIINHMKEYEYYNYHDTYEDDEDAYNDIDRTLGKNGYGIKECVLEDINNILKHEDVRDPYIKKHLEDSVNLGIKVNEYVNNLKDLEKDNISI